MPDSVKTILIAALLAAAMSAAGCTETTNISSGGPTGAASEPTPSASAFPSTTGMETTAETGTLENGPGGEPDIVLRVEGDSGVTFSGLCEVGGEEAVLGGGQVPERYEFATRGQRLSCRIQKQDSGDGDLKVTLLADGSTHSVQQVNAPDSAINVTYDSG